MRTHAQPVLFVLVLILFLSVASSTPATTISVRGHSNYGQGIGEQLGGTQTFTLSDGTVLSAQAECPTGGASSQNGICDLMFVYTIQSLGSSASNLGVSFTGLSNFNFNGQAIQAASDFNGTTYANFSDATPYGFLGTDANFSALPGLDPLAITATGSATGGLGAISFSINNAQVGLSFFFIDTATTQVCNFGDIFDCSDLSQHLDLAAIPTPQGTTSTPEPGTIALVLVGMAGIAFSLKRNRY